MAWVEPVIPPTQGALDLTQTSPGLDSLLLKALTPSVVMLKGPEALRFSSFTVALTANSLVRNMAKPYWGTSRSTVEVAPGPAGGSPESMLEFLLPTLTRLDGIGIQNASGAQEAHVYVKEERFQPLLSALPLDHGSAYLARTFEAKAVRVTPTGDQVDLFLPGASLPSRVGIALGDDNPLQVFPALMELNSSVNTTDLAEQMNQRWQAAPVQDGIKTVALKLLSQTDGLVNLTIRGAWDLWQPAETGAEGGLWTEPQPALPPTVVELRLDQPLPRLDQLLLRANVPSVVKLTGPADLLFSQFILTATAQELVQNVARQEWGTSRSIVEAPPLVEGGAPQEMLEFLLPGPTRIEAVGIRTATHRRSVRVDIRELGQFRPLLSTLPLHAVEPTDANAKPEPAYTGFKEQAFITDAVRIGLLDEDLHLLLRAPSSPSRVSISIGDDSPLQIFPTVMEPGSNASTRDLADHLNMLWRQAGSGDKIEILLKLTSLTDGIISLACQGIWGRTHVLPEFEVTLDPVKPILGQFNWPATDLPEALVTLRMAGTLSQGKWTRSVTGHGDFIVRITENLSVAQALVLAADTGIGVGRAATAVWLQLPTLPDTEQKIELQLAEAMPDSFIPLHDPLAKAEITLPVDASRYLPDQKHYWFRAPFPKPVLLDGAQISRPLFIVATGRGDGTCLSHRLEQTLLEQASMKPEGQAGARGPALVRNLARAAVWKIQPFSQRTATWIVDLELEPLPNELSALLEVTFPTPNAAPQGVPLVGAEELVGELTFHVTKPPENSPLSFTLRAKAGGVMRVRFSCYQAIAE